MKTSVIIQTPSGQSPFTSKGTGVTGRQQLRYLESLLCALPGQGVRGRLVARPSIKVATESAGAVVTLASVLAADTVTLNGTALTAANGSPGANQFDMSLANDTLVATDLVRALLASATALISTHITASNKKAVITAATVLTGDWVEIAGTRLTARTGTAGVLTGLLVNEWSRTGTDTQCATSLVLAINGHPTLSQIVYALSSAGVVTVYERPPTTGQTIPVSTSGSTLAITGSVTALTAGTSVYFESLVPGFAGNACTIATNNGGRLAITSDSSGRFARGASTTYTY
jgi:hypothetical protein